MTWLAATITGRSFSFTAHAKDIYQSTLNPAGLLKRKLNAASFVATCTDANRSHLLGIEPSATVRRVYHGLNDDFSRLLEGPGESSPPSGSFEILSVGRLVPKKGLDSLVWACAELADAGVDFRARIIGEEGEHGPALRALVDQLGLRERVEFVPGMSQRELLGEYRRANVFCLPCRVLPDGDRDGIPNVLMEAMAAGLAVVTTPISGIPELVEDRFNGLFVPPDDIDALAKALTELAEDSELRDRLARAGRADVQTRFDGWAETESMVELLSGAIEGGR